MYLVVLYLQLSTYYLLLLERLPDTSPKTHTYSQSLQRTPITGLPVLGGTYYAVGGASPTWVPLQGKWHVPALFVY